MARLRYNNESGSLGADPGSGGTTITFSVAPNFATIVSPDYIVIDLDPGKSSFEVVHLTAYTSGATTGTIVRAAEDATNWPAVGHPTGTWAVAPTVNDYPALAFDIVAYGGASTASSDNTTAIQNTIAAAAGITTVGGYVTIPDGTFITGPLTLPPGTTIQGVNGQGFLQTTASSPQSILQLKAGSASPLISPDDTGVKPATFCNISNVSLYGNAINQPLINIPDQGGFVQRSWIMEGVYVQPQQTSVTGSGFAVYIGNFNGACVMRDCYVANQANVAFKGQAGFNGIEWYGSDGLIERCWVSSFGNAGIYCSGGGANESLIIQGGGIFWNNFGIENTSANLNVIGTSIDHNFQHGVYLAAGPANFTNCEFQTNGITTTNTYSHIRIEANNLQLTLNGCVAELTDSGVTTNVVKYMVGVGAATGTVLSQFGNSIASGFSFGTAWTDYTVGGTALASTDTTGTVGGDLSGGLPNPTVVTTHLSSALPVNQGGTGALTLTGIVKGSGTSALAAATSGTDYAPGTSGNTTGLVKSTTGTGALSTAAAGTDYSAGTSAAGTGLVVSTTGTGALTTVAAPAGTVVGTTDSQTLTNKTLTTPIISTITNTGTVTLPTATDTLVARATTDTLTNKRVTQRVTAISSNPGAPTINTDNCDAVQITAQSTTISSFTTNLTGTPTNDQRLLISITDSGTPVVITTWGTSFVGSGTIALPTTTVASTRLNVAFVWDTVASKWTCIGVA